MYHNPFFQLFFQSNDGTTQVLTAAQIHHRFRLFAEALPASQALYQGTPWWFYGGSDRSILVYDIWLLYLLYYSYMVNDG